MAKFTLCFIKFLSALQQIYHSESGEPISELRLVAMNIMNSLGWLLSS